MQKGWKAALVVTVFGLSLLPGLSALAYQGEALTADRAPALRVEPQAPLRVADLWDWVKRNLESDSAETTSTQSAASGGSAGQDGRREETAGDGSNYPRYPGEHTTGVGSDGGDSGDSGGH